MNVLIYGHSQSGGMGLDLVSALKKAGHSVERVTRIGYTDPKLLQEAPTSAADRVVLYAGGNTDKADPESIRKLIDHFGKERTVVVLGPVNADNPKADLWRARNAGNVEGLKDHVRVYSVEASGKEFWPDKLHMKPKAPSSVQLAKQIVTDLTGKIPPDDTPVLLYVGAGLLLFLLLRSRG